VSVGFEERLDGLVESGGLVYLVQGAFGDDEGDVVVLLGGAEALDLFDD
jgi:hypothetical protein